MSAPLHQSLPNIVYSTGTCSFRLCCDSAWSLDHQILIVEVDCPCRSGDHDKKLFGTLPIAELIDDLSVPWELLEDLPHMRAKCSAPTAASRHLLHPRRTSYSVC